MRGATVGTIEDAVTLAGPAARMRGACTDCPRAGRYRVPPDGWTGQSDEWIAADQYILGADDVFAVVDALNEVLHGPRAIEDAQFPLRIGVSRAAAARTLRHISGSAS
ncbi:hypothetical protein [Nocardia callitridis]|uniref:Uncharacterized protein n=1 Tax=Nocardia callitridis TaxID=648753 RepID=A0ABP9KF33_9NOCA